MTALATLGRRLARSRMRRYVVAAGTVIGIAAWLAFAPPALGGSSVLVTTYGTSMEPTLHGGDLVVVRPQHEYRVGDVVAYRSEQLGTVVLHRIIAREGDAYVFKGDNNTWIDEERPRADDLIGAMDTHYAGMGARMQQLRSPVGIGAVVGVGLLPSAAARRRGRRGHRRRSAGPDANRRVRRPPSLRQVDTRLLVAAGAAAVVTVFAFTRPTVVDATSDIPFDDRGEFSYSGTAPGGDAVYPTGSVTSGQPVFLNLVERVDVAFRYDVGAVVPVDAAGEIALRGELADANGWSYPFELAPATPFAGGGGETAGTIDLAAIRQRITAMEAATGAARDSYTVRVVAEVEREVAYGDTRSPGSFSAPLEFRLDELELSLVTPDGEALAPSQGGLLTSATERTGAVELLGQSLPISVLRAGALGTLVIVVALLAEALARSTRRRDESGLIRRRYRSYLLPVRSIELAQSAVVDVESIAALARLADHTSGPILTGGPDSDEYYVVDGARVYRYSSTPVVDVHASVDVTAEVVPTVAEAPSPALPGAAEADDALAGQSAMRRSWRWLPAVAMVCVLTSTTAGQTVANNVPQSRAEHHTVAITPNDLKPTQCAAISLTAKRSGQGTINGANTAELITGSGVVDTIDGGSGNDCILGGAGNDTLRGSQGTDVCIGGAGTDTFHSSCETQLQ